MSGYTKADNWLWDTVMPRAKPNTFKVVATVVRLTAGWQREEAEITFDDFQRMTGIAGRSTLNRAISDALECGFVERREAGRGRIYSTKMVLNESTEMVLEGEESVPGSYRDQYQNGTENSTKTVLATSGTLKEKKGNERGEESPPPSVSPNGNGKIPDPAIADAMNALVEVTGKDGHKFLDQHYHDAVELLEGGYTGEKLRMHYGRASPGAKTWNWYSHDWRGKKGEFPTVRAIWETISGATKWQPLAGQEDDWLADLEYRPYAEEP